MESGIKSVKIQTFTDLIVWKEGHTLVLMVYKITKTFPKEEIYSLTNQMRRSAISITSNIAEGFGRKSYKEKLQFYYQSIGSLTELYNQVIIAHDVNYLNDKEYNAFEKQLLIVYKLLNAFIVKTKSYI